MIGGAILVAATLLAIGGSFWGSARRAREFERNVRTFWQLVSLPIALRRPTDEDALLVAQLEQAAAKHIELERYLRPLGDLMESIGRSPVATPMRVYATPDGTIVAYLYAPDGRLTFESFGVEHEYATVRPRMDGMPRIALPPYIRRQYVRPDATPADMLEHHRALIASADADLVRVTTLDQAREQFLRSHQRTHDWRAARDPDELLASDLRILLGPEEFAKSGEVWLRRFRKHQTLPRAVLRESARR